jgi:hypothetical protein
MLFGLINKVRMLNGWTTKTAQELDATIRTWGEILNRYKIPLEHYQTLYWRAFDTRQMRLNQGQDVPALDATLLVSHWTGPNGLQREVADQREKARIDEHRYLDAGTPDDLPPSEGFEYFKSLLEKQEQNPNVIDISAAR